MRRKDPVESQVFKQLYPTPPRNGDPVSWAQHLKNNLIPEVRNEALMFYGGDSTTESRYPGLDYSYAPHRRRLNRYPHHRRLFKAFDRLDLTESEIFRFCSWEGTLWARRKYEAEKGTTVLDTTGADIPTWDEVYAERMIAQGAIMEDTETEEDDEHEVDEEEEEGDETASMPKDENDTETESPERVIERQGPQPLSGAVHSASQAVRRASLVASTAALVRS